jgi:hypothetical protein
MAPLHARAAECAETAELDADRLIASFRVRAYTEARRRERHARTQETAAHWRAVASLIARRSGERRGAESSAPTDFEAERLEGAAGSRGAPAPIRLSNVDPLDELERILAVKPQCFRLQFFGVAVDHGPLVLAETEIHATNASGAIRAAVEAAWPRRAVGFRLVDFEGREIFERLKADR